MTREWIIGALALSLALAGSSQAARNGEPLACAADAVWGKLQDAPPYPSDRLFSIQTALRTDVLAALDLPRAGPIPEMRELFDFRKSAMDHRSSIAVNRRDGDVDIIFKEDASSDGFDYYATTPKGTLKKAVRIRFGSPIRIAGDIFYEEETTLTEMPRPEAQPIFDALAKKWIARLCGAEGK